MKRFASLLFFAALAAALSGCLVGPNYHRPKVDLPDTYRDAAPPAAAPSTASTETSLGDAKWWTLFQDPELQSLVHTALQNNYDVQIAASRVLQARSQVVITRSDQFPAVSGVAGDSGLRQPALGAFPAFAYNAADLGLSVAWNLDFWGRYRRATEAARASLLSTEWGRRAVLSSVVSGVASAYFQLRALDLQLEISRETLASRQQSLRLTQTLASGGAGTLLDVRQAEQLVETAAAAIPDLERLIAVQENQINTLAGSYPGPVRRGRDLDHQPDPPEIPAGLPSSLLERRPDIREAEQNLAAANAEIGVARAAFFPQISLTGTGGLESADLAGLFSGTSGMWTYTAGLTQPLFSAGKIKANLKLVEAQRDQAVLAYKQIIQQSFRDISDGLVAYRKYRQVFAHQVLLRDAARQAADLSQTRYRGGVSSYLEVLTNESNYYSAQLAVTQARLNELLTYVQLYNSLGGGWQQ